MSVRAAVPAASRSNSSTALTAPRSAAAPRSPRGRARRRGRRRRRRARARPRPTPCRRARRARPRAGRARAGRRGRRRRPSGGATRRPAGAPSPNIGGIRSSSPPARKISVDDAAPSPPPSRPYGRCICRSERTCTVVSGATHAPHALDREPAAEPARRRRSRGRGRSARPRSATRVSATSTGMFAMRAHGFASPSLPSDDRPPAPRADDELAVDERPAGARPGEERERRCRPRPPPARGRGRAARARRSSRRRGGSR